MHDQISGKCTVSLNITFNQLRQEVLPCYQTKCKTDRHNSGTKDMIMKSQITVYVTSMVCCLGSTRVLHMSCIKGMPIKIMLLSVCEPAVGRAELSDRGSLHPPISSGAIYDIITFQTSAIRTIRAKTIIKTSDKRKKL